MEAGESIVNEADVLVAVWDGKPAAGLGGTADVVTYARNLGKPLIWINSITGKITEERLYHLNPKRGAEKRNEHPRQIVEECFEQLDQTAQRHAPRARHLVQRIILLHLLASAIGLSAPTFGWQGTVGCAIAISELFVLLIALFLASVHRRRHEEWMQSRIEAEIYRSFLATWQIRRRTGRSFKMAMPGFGKLCKNLRLLQSMDINFPPVLSDARDNYLEERLQTQVSYFRIESVAACRVHTRLKTSALCCTVAAVLLTAGYVVLSFVGMNGVESHMLKLFSLILPLASAALFSIILTLEYARRAARYQEMVCFLEERIVQLKMVQTWNGLIRIATESEEELLQEVIEWHSYSRFVAVSH